MNEHTPEHRAEGEPIVGDAPPRAHVLFSNNAYDKLKWVSFVVLPALGAAYFALAQLLELPYGLEVVGVLAILDTLLGAILGKSGQQYKNSDARFDGEINVSQYDEEAGTTDLNVKLDPAAVAEKDEVTVKVNRVN